MCGILGYASTRPAPDGSMLIAARETLHHRGPDDHGVWWSSDCRVGLGHRRLSIIDLTPGGHQPMIDATGELVVVFNGEIYNFKDLRRELAGHGHRFHTASDTEVLLAAYRQWGFDCILRLNGMFAFALYDDARRRLFLARDRAGEKPLYYRVDDSGLRFGSELKALTRDPSMSRRIDPVGLDCYLAMGYVPGERTILSGVNKLPPAHAMSFDVETGNASTWRYWQIPAVDPAASEATESALLEELEPLLEDAVRRQLVADVPVGVLLSGGTDSSLITAMAVRSAARVKTFTVRFPGFARYDETPHARLIARHFGTDHAELEAEQTSVELLPALARQYDEPMADSSMIPTYLVSRLIRQHCTVALGGDGGDELFGGYGHYRRLLRLASYTGNIPRSLRRGVASAASMLPVGFHGRNWLQALGSDFDCDIPPVEGLFDAGTRRRLMAGRDWSTTADAIRASRTPATRDVVQRATRMDFENYLAEDILVKVDRASMLNSLEVRAPFLDHRLVEFAFAKVPSSLKATSVSLKVLLKKLCARLLPPAFDQQHKWGFSIPLADWLRTDPWTGYFHDVLLAGSDSLFSRRAVQDLFDGHRKGRNNAERLFALILFELWRREYGATL
jgi:asparagine synthase (glutamine-hydrolysing)